jgi:NAD(P)-dependent dehydrogenase (short-subunit alcohol dehydrogenase family)
MRGLKDKIIIVAGAARGNIGGATAMRLAEEGAIVVAADLSEAGATSVAEDIRAAGGRAIGRAFDITDERSYAELIESTAADLSSKTVGRDTDVLSVPLEIWRHTFDVTLTGYMFGIRHALPIMLKQGSGSIVNTMSSSVWLGEDRRVSYQTAKSALYGLTRHTATLGGKRGVRCNSLAPGLVLTAPALRELSEEYRTQFLTTVRSPRLGIPEDIASVVAFLLSDDAVYINGQTLLVDGGANFT